MKPPIKWAGGKTRLAKHLLPIIGIPKRRYVEPFCGSAAIFFALEPGSYPSLLNDVSPQVIKMLSGLQKRPGVVERTLAHYIQKQQLHGYQPTYDFLRSLVSDPIGDSGVYAATFIAVNQTCFNGLWRVNQSGAFNAPIGYKSKGVPHNIKLIDARSYSRCLKYTELTAGDFRDVVCEKGDTAYCDPPYVEQFSSYSEGGFNTGDHEDLAEWCAKQVRRGAKVILSGTDNKETRRIYGKPHTVVNRACTIGASSRGSTRELIYVYE